ncbi:MAG TPA: DUF481 domain-containing protein [Bryobacteraceae bacterium]
MRAAVMLSALIAEVALQAQTPPDIMILNDGEKLIGHLVSSTGTSVTFKSDLAGEIKMDWSKIKELHSSAKFAVAEKGVVFRRHDDLTKVPQGTVSMSDQKIEVSPANGTTPQSIPVANTQNLVPEESFLRAFQRPKWSDYWHGSAGLGVALVAATQDSRTITSSVSLVRTVPNETWIDPRYRTTIDFNSAYGSLSEPGQPTVKTDILHADAEQDEYLSSRLFGFGQLAFDHSISQGLDLQQTYGGGLGYTVLKAALQELDLKGQIAYVSQMFTQPLPPQAPVANKHLIAAVITETYNRTFKREVTLHEQLSVTPAFNEAKAYSAIGTVDLSIPVFKKLAFTIGTVDAYLNDPPLGFKKNSFQFVTNLSYTIN